jgi:site-specific recombinase XerD
MTTTLLLPAIDLTADGDHLRRPDEAQLAAAAFLARCNGRTLETYRHDLRYCFQSATDQHLDVLSAARTHTEIYRSTMEQRGLAASTIDRRLSTVCGYYRFAHIDGRIPANPAQYLRRPNGAARRAARNGSRRTGPISVHR